MENKSFEQPINTDNKNFFESPLDNNKITSTINEVMRPGEMKEDKIIFTDKINKDLDYLVGTNGPILSFYIKDKNGDNLANFKFRQDGKDLVFIHREIDDKLRNHQINGSMFLSKNEEFFKILLANSHDQEVKDFLIDSGQVGVVRWVLKNNYHFINPEQEALFKKILARQENDYLVTDQFQSNGKYKGYIFKKENLKKAETFLNKKTASGEDRDNIGLGIFTERFRLIKEIKGGL